MLTEIQLIRLIKTWAMRRKKSRRYLRNKPTAEDYRQETVKFPEIGGVAQLCND